MDLRGRGVVDEIFIGEMRKRYRNVYKMDEGFPWYDVLLVKDDGEVSKIYVRCDVGFRETGNVAVEMEFRGDSDVQGGILHSKADYVVYYLDGDWWVCGKDKLIIWILDAEVRMVGGVGNGAYMALIPIDEFKKVFQRLFQPA